MICINIYIYSCHIYICKHVCMYIYHIYIHIHTYVHIRIHKYLDSSNCNWMHDDSCTIHAQIHPCQYWMIWFFGLFQSCLVWHTALVEYLIPSSKGYHRKNASKNRRCSIHGHMNPFSNYP